MDCKKSGIECTAPCKPNLVVYACDLSIREVEIGRSSIYSKFKASIGLTIS